MAQTVDTRQAERAFPRNQSVETSFRQGLDAFEQGRYEAAIVAFRDVIDRPTNRRTTSAMLLAGKAAYALGQYREAIDVLERLTRRYPRTRYAAAAKETISNANRSIRLTEFVLQEGLELAVILPLNEDSRRFSHSLVTGIRMAVDEYNRSAEGKPVRVRFRDSGGSETAARRAVEALARETTPDVILGPLFSEEALTAASVAERYRIPMLVPLATDDRVSSGRDFVFQANPSYEIRGRAMARYAVQRRRFRRLGVVSEVETFANRMARAFSDEVSRLGGEVLLERELSSKRDWYVLSDSLDADSLTGINAIYMPVTGENARDLIQIGVDELDQLSPDLQLFGNGEWDALQRSEQAERHRTICALDFRLDLNDADVVRFATSFRDVTRREPDRAAYMGYDTARFVLSVLASDPESVSDAIRRSEPFDGLATRIHFRNGQINQSLIFAQYRDGKLVVDG